MYETEYNEKRYCFFDDHMTINGVSIPYERMADIGHRGGDAPAFVFTYHDPKHGDRRFSMSYPPEELPKILPYLKKASAFTEQTQESVEEPMEETPDETTAPEPFPVSEPDDDTIADELISVEEEGSQTTVEEVMTPESGDLSQPVDADPENSNLTSDGHLESGDPTIESSPRGDVSFVPDNTSSTPGDSQETKGSSKKKGILIGAIIAAVVVIAIIAFAVIGGSGSKTTDITKDNLKPVAMEDDKTGSTKKVEVRTEDADPNEYAVDYYNKYFSEGDKVHWIVDEGMQTATSITDNGDGTITVQVHEYVEGEDASSDTIGKGDVWEEYTIDLSTEENLD